jgi:hypothetical protein
MSESKRKGSHSTPIVLADHKPQIERLQRRLFLRS